MSDGGGAFLFLRMEEGTMPETKVESIIFTAVTAWIMVYIMTLYNTVIAGEDFVNATFLVALRGMWLEFVLIFLCAYFISGPAARRLTFRIVKSEDRPIVIIVTMPDFYRRVSGGSCEYPGRVLQLWTYRAVDPGLYYDLLPEFYHGSAGAVVSGGAGCESAVPRDVSEGSQCGAVQSCCESDRERWGRKVSAAGAAERSGDLFQMRKFSFGVLSYEKIW